MVGRGGGRGGGRHFEVEVASSEPETILEQM